MREPGGIDRTVTTWAAWTRSEVYERLAGLDGVRWAVAGGWAVRSATRSPRSATQGLSLVAPTHRWS